MLTSIAPIFTPRKKKYICMNFQINLKRNIFKKDYEQAKTKYPKIKEVANRSLEIIDLLQGVFE